MFAPLIAAALLPFLGHSNPPAIAAMPPADGRAHTSAARRARRKRAGNGIPICETYLSMSQGSPATTIIVEWGEIFTDDPVCLSSGSPDGATFHFTVNGVDRTSYFTINGDGATGTNVPLSGGSTTNKLRATITGHDTSNNPRTDSTMAFVPLLTVTPAVTSGARALVHTRWPLILATYSDSQGIDSTSVVLKLRSLDLTSLARRNRRLLEWEVDSLRQLSDSALLSVKVCSNSTWCNELTRWLVLDNSGPPIVSFGAMPLEAQGRQFRAPFGPGLSVAGAEVETGFSVPSYFSMGTARSTGLVYSTRQSHPRALVQANVELTWPAGTPDQIKAVLLDGVVRLDSVVISSPSCSAAVGRRCRIALQGDFASSTFSRAARKWLRVEVTVTSGGTPKATTDSVEVVVVDRRTSPYGSGWAVGGVLRLDSAGTDMLLVGATGATTVYRGSGGTYISPPGDFSVLAWTGTVWELRFRDGAKLVFNSAGRETQAVDRNGNTSAIAYVGSTDQVYTVADPGGAFMFYYDAGGKLAWIRDPDSRFSGVTISGSNQLVYDSLSSPTNNPAVAAFTYSSSGANSAIVLATRADALAHSTTVGYSNRWRPTQATLPAVLPDTGASTVSPVVGYAAQELRALGTLISADSVNVSVTDPRGNWTRSTLNRWGAAARTWDVLGTLTRIAYTADGFVAWAEGKVSDSTRVYNTYDALGRRVRTYRLRTASDTVRLDSLVYDTSHRVTQRVDARGRVSRFGYDTKGNVLWSATPQPDTTRFTYRSDGQLDSVRAPGANKGTRYYYDLSWSNVISLRDPQGREIAAYTYDNLGRRTQVQRRLIVAPGATPTYQWRRTIAYYNSANQQDSVRIERSDNCTPCNAPPTWPSAGDTLRTRRVRMVYNRLGLDSLRYGSRGTTASRYAYDALGRLRVRWPWTDSGSVQDSFRYDLAGNLRYQWTRRGTQLEHRVDSRNRDTLTIVPGVGDFHSAYAGPNDELTRAWITSYSDSIGAVNPAVSWVYTQTGLVLSDTSQGNRVTTHLYDRYGRDTLATDVTGNWRVRYDTTLGIIDSVMTPWADTLVYAYDNVGRATGPTVRNGTVGPDFTRSQSWSVGGDLASFSNSHGYNVGNMVPDTAEKALPLLAVWTEQSGSGAATRTFRDSVVNDGWQQVLRALYLRNDTVIASDTFNFDYDGNIRLNSESRTYDPVTTRLTLRGGSGYTYDRAGNLVGRASQWAYTYDALDRLITVRHDGYLIARYAYDVLGRRIVKRVYADVSRYERMIYRGGEVIADADSAGTLQRGYTWGFGSDDLVAIHDYGLNNRYYVSQDELRSVRALSRKDGTFIASFRYRAYGAVLDSVGTLPSGFELRYRWIGREYDAETGFYYLRARYYDPASQRFTQEDPTGYSGGVNLYAYGNGNPMNGRDLDGLRMILEDVRAFHGFGGGGFGGSGEDLSDWMDDLDVNWDRVYADVTGGILTDCGHRNCGSAVTILANAGVQALFRQMMRETLRDGNERGTWLIEVNQQIMYTPIQTGTRGDVDPGPMPGNALAEVHTHPADASGDLSLWRDNARYWNNGQPRAVHYFVVMPEAVYALDYYRRRGRPVGEWRWDSYRWNP